MENFSKCDSLGKLSDAVFSSFSQVVSTGKAFIFLWNVNDSKVTFARWYGFDGYPTSLLNCEEVKTALSNDSSTLCEFCVDCEAEFSNRDGTIFEHCWIGIITLMEGVKAGAIILKGDAISFSEEELCYLRSIFILFSYRLIQLIYKESVERIRGGFAVIFSALERMLKGEDEASILNAITGDMLSIFDAQYVVAFRYDKKEDILVPVFRHGFEEVLPLKPGEGVGGRAFKEKRPVLVSDILTDLPNGDVARKFYMGRLGSVISVPYFEDNVCIGVLCLARARYKPPFTENELSLLRLFAHLFEAILSYVKVKKKEREQELLLFRSQKMEALGLLAGGIAHDFNNILNSIMGLAEILKLQLEKEENIHYIDMIIEQVRHGASLTKQLLDFARKSPSEKVPIDLVVFLKEFVRFIRRTFPSTIRIKFDTTETSVVVLGDVAELQQALLNICINAKDAMPDGGELILVLRADREEGKCIVEVRDTGFGMSEDVLERCFDPFFTTKGEFGTGLGLPQALGIVEKHGGKMEIESKKGIGTVVRIILPIYFQATVPIKREMQKKVLPRGSGEEILLVDDDKSSLIVIKGMLEMLGYRVRVAVNGREALQLLKEKKPDIVITDIVMPEVDGITLANNIREFYRDLPVILLSGYAMDKMANSFVMKGFYFLQKPVSISELAIKVKEALSRDRNVG